MFWRKKPIKKTNVANATGIVVDLSKTPGWIKATKDVPMNVQIYEPQRGADGNVLASETDPSLIKCMTQIVRPRDLSDVNKNYYYEERPDKDALNALGITDEYVNSDDYRILRSKVTGILRHGVNESGDDFYNDINNKLLKVCPTYEWFIKNYINAENRKKYTNSLEDMFPLFNANLTTLETAYIFTELDKILDPPVVPVAPVVDPPVVEEVDETENVEKPVDKESEPVKKTSEKETPILPEVTTIDKFIASGAEYDAVVNNVKQIINSDEFKQSNRASFYIDLGEKFQTFGYKLLHENAQYAKDAVYKMSFDDLSNYLRNNLNMTTEEESLFIVAAYELLQTSGKYGDLPPLPEGVSAWAPPEKQAGGKKKTRKMKRSRRYKRVKSRKNTGRRSTRRRKR